VEKVFPDLVNTHPETNMKSIQYGNLIAPLIEAVKDQQKQIQSMKEEIESLRNQLNNEKSF